LIWKYGKIAKASEEISHEIPIVSDKASMIERQEPEVVSAGFCGALGF
jgi:hypothetical protein